MQWKPQESLMNTDLSLVHSQQPSDRWLCRLVKGGTPRKSRGFYQKKDKTWKRLLWIDLQVWICWITCNKWILWLRGWYVFLSFPWVINLRASSHYYSKIWNHLDQCSFHHHRTKTIHLQEQNSELILQETCKKKLGIPQQEVWGQRFLASEPIDFWKSTYYAFSHIACNQVLCIPRDTAKKRWTSCYQKCYLKMTHLSPLSVSS